MLRLPAIAAAVLVTSGCSSSPGRAGARRGGRADASAGTLLRPGAGLPGPPVRLARWCRSTTPTRRGRDQAGPDPPPAHRVDVPRRDAGQPRWSRWLRADHAGARRLRARATSGASYDWIGFDPRGVGRELAVAALLPPLLRLRPAQLRAEDAVDHALLAGARTAAYSAACANTAAKRALLPHLTTLDTVRDMELIRAGAGRRAGSASTATPTAPTSARSTRPGTRRGWAGSSSTAW